MLWIISAALCLFRLRAAFLAGSLGCLGCQGIDIRQLSGFSVVYLWNQIERNREKFNGTVVAMAGVFWGMHPDKSCNRIKLQMKLTTYSLFEYS